MDRERGDSVQPKLREFVSDHFEARDTDRILRGLERFGRLIQEWGRRGNLVSRGDQQRIFTRHLPESLRVAARVHDLAPGSVIDIGSGSGLPGIPIALTSPGAEVVLLESRRMKSLFLLKAIRELELEHCYSWCARAESIGRKIEDCLSGIAPGATGGATGSRPDRWTRLAVEPPEYIEPFDVATARAVAPLPELARLAAPLVRVGGALLATKGSRLPGELEAWGERPGPWKLDSIESMGQDGVRILTLRRI